MTVTIDTKYRERVAKETRNFTYFEHGRRPKIGERRVFVYGAYSEPASHVAHRFHIVEVMSETDRNEYDFQGERMYEVRADDGWTGQAWASELFPLPRTR